MKQNNKTHILFRYGLITLGFFLFALLIVAKLIDTTVVSAPAWNKRAQEELNKTSVIPPERGNILASNGNILACNLKVYDIKIDLRHNKIRRLKDIPYDKIDSLADSLDFYYPRISNLQSRHPDTIKKYSWHTRLRAEFEKDPDKRPRALRLAAKKTLDDFATIRNFPFLRDFKGRSYNIPVYKEEKNVRIYPYGKMAALSIGRVNEQFDTREFHGYSGLERDLDSLLYGKPGIAKKVALTSGLGNWVKQAPVRGYDLHTTIDIDIQDILEQELLKICQESNAVWGTALIMEVATGEIKAISNIEHLEDGTYGEALNRAVLGFEPGSVMKPISMMIAFEDGLVHNVNETVSCAPFQRTSDPHAPGVKTMRQVIEMSSNTGISRVIFRGYESKPEAFYDRLASIGFFEPMHSGIAEEHIPKIRRLIDHDSKGNRITMTARHLDLARQAYGYNTMIPPLYTLSIYNAIANGGKYVRPHLLRALTDENGVDSILPIPYIRDSICSRATAEKLKVCLNDVVWGDHGTARAVRDDRVKVVGKTGTAFPVEKGVYNKSKRRYAFAGFFPYENPRYSCMALIFGPAGTSANRTSGQLVKNMAINMYSRGMLDNASHFDNQTSGVNPVVTPSQYANNKVLKEELGIHTLLTTKKPAPLKSAKAVPDVRGYDAPTAIRILEKLGLNVQIEGAGRVVAQSIPEGAQFRRGDNIKLNLQI